jgi:tetratricopeptide (TPR) repeat protein
MTNPKLDSFRAMVTKSPNNALAHYGVANEALKAGLHEEALAHYREYLARADDEGNAYGKVAEALEKLGRTEEAREALRQGMAASLRFGHPSMAAELEERLQSLSD